MSDKKQTIPSFEEFKASATGDFKKFNDETLRAIYEGHYRINLTRCESIEDFKKSLESND